LVAAAILIILAVALRNGRVDHGAPNFYRPGTVLLESPTPKGGVSGPQGRVSKVVFLREGCYYGHTAPSAG
jgi:hypothetical protein